VSRARITLGILAGGQALRLDGADKALRQYHGRALAQRCLDALGGGFAAQLASYNGSHAAELPAALRVVPDLRKGYPGPLGGIEALLAASASDWLLTVPVDLIELPADLDQRLLALVVEGRGVAARDGDGSQPLVALWPVASSRAAVTAALDAGERAVHRAQHVLGFATCDLSPLRLGNLNTPDDFDAA
jgi:molybdopterin-guanine dinucleotide biosynthesis protein A